ncbi:MAG: DegT/DnrJ/EryC1/StrS family aminotransferase [Patescibacteria group bacterium]
MKIPIFDLVAQYKAIQPEIDEAIQSCLNNSAFINGEANKKFESAFAKYCEVKHCVGVSSGSSALELALEALEIQKGDEIICPSHTFAATAEAIVHRGAKPIFVDIDESTYNIDPNLIERKISKKTRAIVVVHLYGQMADMGQIMSLARKYKLRVVEDAAQAHGAKYKNKRAGSIADIATFSFFPAKNLGSLGDGGAVLSNNSKLAKKVRLLKDHGRISKYEHKIVGYGERLDNIQAAVLLIKLKYLNKWNRRRRQIAKIYDKAFTEKYTTPTIREDNESVFYTYTLRHKKRKQIQKKLAKKGISTGIYYPKPLHLQESFRYLGYKKGDLPISEKISKEIFAIPIYPELSEKQIAFIVKTLNSVAI